MSESESGTARSQTDSVTDDDDAPWNREYTEAEIAQWNNGVIQEFRDNGGKVGGAYEGGELILLGTVGARSGKRHVVPLGLLRRGDTLYVSSLIEDKYPAWFHNVKAQPRVTVELGADTFHATAKALAGAEYAEFASWVREHNPALAKYQAKVSRPLPLVVLEFDRRS
ncbi:nitroreductase/quinone reductase family protein [Nocardia sp. NPDC050710]|uniref:nitroreductase/quinone reductase family protein n=1 Tax=Nocardia sp. NPDC050710 TaxID=3157220 RepID=UPI00341195E7